MIIQKNGDAYGVRLGEDALAVAPAPDQDRLIEFYMKTKAEGTLQRFFHERVPTPLEFLSDCVSRDHILLGAYRLCMDTYSLIGIGKAGRKFELGSGHGKRELGQLFLRKEKRTLLLGQLMLQWVFDKCADTDILYGCTPTPNRAAVLYMKRIGFAYARDPLESYASWQGKPCSAMISWMTREKWATVTPFGSDSAILQ